MLPSVLQESQAVGGYWNQENKEDEDTHGTSQSKFSNRLTPTLPHCEPISACLCNSTLPHLFYTIIKIKILKNLSPKFYPNPNANLN
jgi:hypothetical protein